ncbi:MAG: ABC transporter permease [Acholeplasmataceae bacterium]
MKKFKYLVSHGLKKRVKSKAFLISSIVVGLIIIIISVLPSIISLFGDEDEGYKIKNEIIIIDETNYHLNSLDISEYYLEGVKNYLVNIGYNPELEITYLTNNDENIPFDQSYYDLEREEDGLIYLTLKVIDEEKDLNDPNNQMFHLKIFNKKIDETLLSVLLENAKELQRLKYLIDNPGVSNDLIGDLMVDLVIDPNLDEVPPFNIIEILAPLLIVPLFILITFSIQAIGADIIEEKSTKAIEIIIASVPPKTHFLAKLTSINLFVVIQLLTYVLFGVIGTMINELISTASPKTGGSWGDIMAMVDLKIIPILIILLVSTVLGSVLYCVIGAFFASLAINQEDYQQIQAPVMMILMVGYFVSIFAGASQSNVVLVIFSYIPFFAPLVLPVTYAAGSLSTIEVLISLFITTGFILLIIYIISPLYKVSILSYDTSSLFKRIKNIVKSSKGIKKNNNNQKDIT